MECEIPLFYTHDEVVARKVHRCCECIAPIAVGEKHFIATGKWPDDKYPKRFRQHFACEKACEYIRDKFNDWECIGFGYLFEWIGSESYDCMRDNKTQPEVKTFRDMIAKIRRRERAGV